MPYKRLVSNQPPDEADMNRFENEGWSRIQVLGPCAAMDEKTKTKQLVYVIYLWRSIITDHRPRALRGVN